MELPRHSKAKGVCDHESSTVTNMKGLALRGRRKRKRRKKRKRRRSRRRSRRQRRRRKRKRESTPEENRLIMKRH